MFYNLFVNTVGLSALGTENVADPLSVVLFVELSFVVLTSPEGCS